MKDFTVFFQELDEYINTEKVNIEENARNNKEIWATL